MNNQLVRELLIRAKCNQCILSRGKGKPGLYVGPRGDPSKAMIAIIGEAPAKTELSKGKPFVGASGKLIDLILESLDIPKDLFYYSNALMCHYPPTNKPTKSTVEACHGRLKWELKRLPNLKVVISMGGYALQSLTGKTQVTKEVYSVYWDDELKCFILPSYHPAFCFRNVEAFDDIVWCFERAIDLTNRNKNHLNLPKLKIHVARNHAQAIRYLDKIASIEEPTWTAIDWETDYANPVEAPTLAIGFYTGGDKVYIIPWVSGEPEKISEKWDIKPNKQMVMKLHEIANNPNVRGIFHNGDFDVRVAWYNSGALFNVHYDTMLSDYALDERGGGDQLEGIGGGIRVGSHRLKSAAKRYLYCPDWEGDIKRYLKSSKTNYSHIPRPRLYTYLAYDVYYTWHLRQKHEQVLTDEEPSRKEYWTPKDRVHKLLIPALNEIIKMEIGGINIDRGKAHDVQYELGEKLKKLSADICSRARKLGWEDEREFNMRSHPQMAKLIYDVMKIPCTLDLRTGFDGKVNKTERPTGKDTLAKLSEVDEIFANVISHRETDRMKGTYVDAAIEGSEYDGNLHGGFSMTVTRTGRLSSRGPNLQNLLPLIKEYYLPDDGHVFVNMDYKQLEVRVAALFSKDKGLIKACKGDIHGEISRNVFAHIYKQIDDAVSTEELEDVLNQHGILTPIKSEHAMSPVETVEKLSDKMRKSLRKSAKPIIFGVMYGREAFSLASLLKISVGDAQRYINNLFKRFPKLYAWLERAKKEVIDYGWIESPSGQRRRFPFINEEFEHKILKQTINAPIQGFASDICLMAFIKIAPMLREKEWGRVLLLVHDSLAFSIKKECLEEAIPAIKELMQNAYESKDVKFLVDVETGPNYKNLSEWR